MRARQSLAPAFGLLFALSVLVFAASPIPASATAESFLWGAEDVKGLDPWGDATDDAHDLVAVYAKESDGLLHFRADVMDARDDSRPDLFLAIDYKPGGASVLIGGRPGPAASLEWDLLLSLTANGEARALDPAFADHPEFLHHATFDTTLDYAEFALYREALPDWDGSPFSVQALALDASGNLADEIEPAVTDAAAGRGKLVLVFGNMFSATGPHAISWYDGYAFPLEDHPGERHGYKYLYDAAEKYGLPLTLIDLRVEVLPGLDYMGVADRLRDLAARGLIDPITTTTYGYLMPWQPAEADAMALRLAREHRAAFDLPAPDVLVPYETWLTAGDLDEIREAGYTAIYAYDRYGYWFDWIKDTDWGIPGAVEAWHEAQRKIHMIDGVRVFFGLQGFYWDARWNGLSLEPGWFLQRYDSFAGTDGGLHHGWRRELLDLALDPDQEKYIAMGTDLWLTSWYFGSDAERSLRWLKAHPWIEVTTFSDLLARDWTPVDHGDLGLPPEAPMDRYMPIGGASSGDYFWQGYYGGISDGRSPLVPAGEAIEGYFDYVPYLNGAPIPSGMKMGDDRTPGTIVYETLANLRAAPDNALTHLAWLAYFMSVPEQTFHASKAYASGEFDPNDPGGRYFHPNAKVLANHLRQVNKLAAAARWAEAVARGEVPAETQLLLLDLDLDGEDEFVLKNDRAFLVFENDGGRLEYAFAYSPAGGAVQWVGPTYQFQFTGYSNYAEGETPPADWPWREAAFEDIATATGEEYRDDLYAAKMGAEGLTFVSPDGRVRKTFTLDGETLTARYSVEGMDELTVASAFAANPTGFNSRGWWADIEQVQTPESMGWQVPGGSMVLDFSGTRLNTTSSFLNDPYRDEMREMDLPVEYMPDHWAFFPYSEVSVTGSGKFELRLTFGETSPPASATQAAAEVSPVPADATDGEGISGPGPLIAVCGGLALVGVVFAVVLWRRRR